ncbi:hypothetical protein NEFER03_0995 [Nematocida sp. LUAm3]|nr:hypothetical protein NEFER03_0995 [Nematocida sp. LUAm3]KAI5175401.1 hypothetical protein NEFER02_1330 [Nematocida sp. LUAm2]KAI5177642.1 hypothetical protein NEFER01_0866 [Nematocida sp. LUAm1]
MKKPKDRIKSLGISGIGQRTTWDSLVRAHNIGKYIRSLDRWSFFINPDTNVMQKRYLVVDLEGILLHSTLDPPSQQYDFYIQYAVEDQIYTHYVILRPMLMEFFDTLLEWYEIVLYSTMNREYVDRIADRLEKGKRIFTRRLYRDECNYFEGRFVRDLKKITENMSIIVVLESSPFSYMNKLPIDPYDGCSKDRSLLSSIMILECLRFCSDVRSILELSQL